MFIHEKLTYRVNPNGREQIGLHFLLPEEGNIEPQFGFFSEELIEFLRGGEGGGMHPKIDYHNLEMAALIKIPK